ncbi:MAG: transporter [Flavobacteriales bacterium]|nr:transporter [Flavobacteriales bacterium]
MQKQTQDPGFGQKYAQSVKRIINKDGTFNVIKRGTDSGLKNLFQQLINMNIFRFIFWVCAIYFIANIVFGFLFVINGPDNLSGRHTVGFVDGFFKSFFFSIQTFTTVGYGAISPIGVGANLIASLAALAGSMYFALVTGLIYGRFSRPKSKLVFSHDAIVAPYNEGEALMFRLANRRPDVLMMMNAEVMVVMRDGEKGKMTRNFYRLDLEYKTIHFMPLSWTVVHPIIESSPLYGKTKEELIECGMEVLILISGFDEVFSQDVHARFSYTAKEITFNAKFDPAYHVSDSGEVKMDINKIHDYQKLD